MRVVAIIQARMGSTRLPGKSMLPLAGLPVVSQVVARVQRATCLQEIVLACPSQDVELFTKSPCAPGAECSVYGYEGDENDLVDRYLEAAETFDADIIVRVCADNPCIEPEYIDAAVDMYMKIPIVFYSNTTASCNEVLVDGIGAEVFSISRLKWLDQATKGQPNLREHPHKLFNYAMGDADVRLDVNTQADYDFIRDIYDHFGHNRFHIGEVLGYLHVTR